MRRDQPSAGVDGEPADCRRCAAQVRVPGSTAAAIAAYRESQNECVASRSVRWSARTTRVSKGTAGAAAITTALGLFAASCFRIPVNSEFRLGVPYREWKAEFYCGPAAILMWALYDGRPELPQEAIASSIGMGVFGASEEAIARGVRQFTGSFNAEIDYPAGPFPPSEAAGKFFARQITSIEDRTPVIGIKWGGLHAVTLDGGKFHLDSSTNRKVWDYVRVHDPDPEFGSNYRLSAADWSRDNTSQIIAREYVPSGDQNYQAYGQEVSIAGRPDLDACRTRAGC